MIQSRVTLPFYSTLLLDKIDSKHNPKQTMAAPYSHSRSPPPLVHPRPSHISQPPPEPIATPDLSRLSVDQARASFDAARQSSEGYTRFSSPPATTATAYGGAGAGAGTGPAGAYDPYGPAASFSSFPQQGAHDVYGGGGAAAQQGTSSMYNPALQGAPQQPGSGFQSMMGGLGGGGAPWSMGVGLNEATANMIGKAGHDYVEQNVHRYIPLPLLKTMFSVTNSYVLNKLRLVLFPWRHKTWSRQVASSSRRHLHHDGGGGSTSEPSLVMEGWMSPRDDINSPDLYIPTMSLVTYTLLAAFASGLQSRFHPEVLGVSLSKSIAVVVGEVCGVRLGCYLLDVRGSGASVVELVGYGGYKFVG